MPPPPPPHAPRSRPPPRHAPSGRSPFLPPGPPRIWLGLQLSGPPPHLAWAPTLSASPPFCLGSNSLGPGLAPARLCSIPNWLGRPLPLPGLLSSQRALPPHWIAQLLTGWDSPLLPSTPTGEASSWIARLRTGLASPHSLTGLPPPSTPPSVLSCHLCRPPLFRQCPQLLTLSASWCVDSQLSRPLLLPTIPNLVPTL
jgi:hypothetical protein